MIGNIGRYLNHSCDPNLIMIPVRTDCLVPSLALFTSRPVEAGQELCYHYGDSSRGMEEVEDSETAQESTRTRCQCKSSSCSTYLPFDSDLS